MNTSKTNPLHTVVRWAARISSIPILIVFLLMFFGEGFDPAKVKPIEWVMLVFGPFGLMLGMILGWWKEGLGGAIAVVSFFGAMLVGGYNASGAGYMLICASPGFLFLLAWFLSKTTKTTEAPAYEENMAEPSSPLVVDPGVLEARKARIAEGLCPKCGTPLKPADESCPSCRLDLVYARENLGQW